MGYRNPLLLLSAAKALAALPAEHRAPLQDLLREMQQMANAEAEKAWKKRKGPMAMYWRMVATYCRHTRHALSKGVTP